MPKNRKRKPKGQARPVARKHSAVEIAQLRAQKAAFREKFGRDPGPNDPVFFDPTKEEPEPLEEDIEQAVLAAMHKADLPPEFAYAFRKTGLIGLTQDKSRWPPERIKEWDDAIDEYHAITAASRNKPKGWNTQIVELLLSPFTQEDYDQVGECVRAIAPIEALGMKVVTRIELAAALLASACDHGYTSGQETGEGPEVYAITEELVLRRAREVYAQGHG